MPGWLERAVELARRSRLLPAGLAFAIGFACLSLTPSLLPRSPLAQGVVSGAAAASGYGVGVFLAWCWRGLRDRPREPWPDLARSVLLVGGVAALLTSLAAGVRWQAEAHDLAGTEATPVAFVLLVPPVTLVVAALFLGLARGARAASRRVARLLERRLRPSVARVLGVVSVGFVAWALLSGVAADAGLRALDASFALGDLETPEGVDDRRRRCARAATSRWSTGTTWAWRGGPSWALVRMPRRSAS